MKLFHAFPRPHKRVDLNPTGTSNIDDPSRLGLQILESILTNGLLCTPEKFELYPNLNTENEEKLEFLKKGLPHDKIVQSRACFTLSDTVELTKEYKVSLNDNSLHRTHTDLFGEFAVGLDPLEARELGIVPTVYYYRNQTIDPLGKINGLGEQIVERLDEARTLFSILSYLEARANPERRNLFPPEHILKEMGINIKFEQVIREKFEYMSHYQAKSFFELLDTDRVPGWNFVDFIHIMLSLYQRTDSTFEDAPLAFFQQREWRLVHHMAEGLDWFGLGKHPWYQNPDYQAFIKNIEKIKSQIKESSPKRDEDYFNWFFNHCWVMAGTSKKHFRNYIREIVVPAAHFNEAKSIIDSFHFINPPKITVLPRRWRIKVKNGIPKIELSPKRNIFEKIWA